MNLRIIITLLSFIIVSVAAIGQETPFQITLEPLNIENVGGIQSYAFGQHDNKWLIVGGRLDGLHQRQPFAAFDPSGNNTQLIVIDPINSQQWSAPMTSLPTSIQEQLSATNAEFFQEGNHLYILGGYGYSPTAGDHITYSNLTALDVPVIINAITNGDSNLSPYFRQITDNEFAVTGGRLEKIYEIYYLVGGHKFMGRYNPMGPNNGPGFFQEYTNEVRKFTIDDDGINITINHLPSYHDEENLHRRDFNVIPQITTFEKEELIAFSGVFQHDVDLPFLNSVRIDSIGYIANNSFSQYYNHYHCANIPLYSVEKKEMHNIFFGGIAQYYDEDGVLVQDNNVPFVNTIARVTRDSTGVLNEYKMPLEMPGYLGAGSEFISVEALPQYDNGVLKLDDFANDTTLVGYIYGGIRSDAKNIFFINNGNQSEASSQIYKVFLIKNDNTTNTHNLNPQGYSTLNPQIFPNPNQGYFSIVFTLKKSEKVFIKVFNIKGEIIEEGNTPLLAAGEYQYEQHIEGIEEGGLFFIQLETTDERIYQKVIITP